MTKLVMAVLAVVAHWTLLFFQWKRTLILLVLTQASKVYAILVGLGDVFVGPKGLEFATRFEKMIAVVRRTFLGSGERVNDSGAKADSCLSSFVSSPPAVPRSPCLVRGLGELTLRLLFIHDSQKDLFHLLVEGS